MKIFIDKWTLKYENGRLMDEVFVLYYIAAVMNRYFAIHCWYNIVNLT